MTTEAQDQLIAEMERFARLAEKLAAEIRRLTVGIKADLDDCLAIARGNALARDENDKGERLMMTRDTTRAQFKAALGRNGFKQVLKAAERAR